MAARMPSTSFWSVGPKPSMKRVASSRRRISDKLEALDHIGQELARVSGFLSTASCENATHELSIAEGCHDDAVRALLQRDRFLDLYR